MDLGLTGKVALVTGASAGLGKAIAEELAHEGADVVLCARRADVLGAFATELAASSGRRIVPIVADLTVAGEGTRVVTEAIAQLGRVDILVTNGGGPPSLPFEQTTPEQWDQAVRMNLLSALELCRAAMPGMKARRWGRILTLTSITVKQPVENLVLSNSVRAAVAGFARTLSNELAPFNITVNNILPGYTKTERLGGLAAAVSARKGITEAEAYGAWEQQIPMGRLGEPREFAALAVFLASDRASYITGQSVAADGGWIKGLF
ncbi:MAG: SDR family oxidoreductase [Gemmatimonadetes bacterium]|nr:SDR family oxidoreductase [Gemmatimonadota bacterium]